MNQLKSRDHRAHSCPRKGVSIVILTGLLVISVCLTTQLAASDFESKTILDVVHVQPFQLEESFRFDWRREKPDVRSGLLVVFKVDPDLVTPRNALEPMLYAGNQTVQRLNHGHESGFVIGIIPEELDLSKVPVWFGTPALPEAIGAEIIGNERARAERLGILPLTSIDMTSRTQDRVVASDLTTLLREQAADLVLQFSPQEKRLADSWRLDVNNR